MKRDWAPTSLREQLEILAADEQSVMLAINGHAHRASAGSNRPLADNFHLLGVDDGNFVLVDEIDKDFALTVRDERLGLAARKVEAASRPRTNGRV